MGAVARGQYPIRTRTSTAAIWHPVRAGGLRGRTVVITTGSVAPPVNFVGPKSIPVCCELPAPDKTCQARARNASSSSVFDIDFHNNISRGENFSSNYVAQTVTSRRIFGRDIAFANFDP